MTGGRGGFNRHFSAPLVEIEFGLFYREGGTEGEILMTWQQAGSRTALIPRLHVYSDGFRALWQLRAVLADLAEKPELSPAEFCELLLPLGYTDLTLDETRWMAHEARGSFYRIHEGVFQTGPMSASVAGVRRRRGPYAEEIAAVDYEAAVRCGETDVDELRAVEAALRSGATDLDDLTKYLKLIKRGGQG